MAQYKLINYLDFDPKCLKFSDLQKSEGGGLGIGGSSSAGGGFMTARGTANFMTKLTAFLGACFFLTSIVLALLSNQNSSSISSEVEKSIETNSSKEPSVPIGN